MALREDYLAPDDECIDRCRICDQELEPGAPFWHDDDDVFHGACIGHADPPIPCATCGTILEDDDIMWCFSAPLGSIAGCSDRNANPIAYCDAHSDHTHAHGRPGS